MQEFAGHYSSQITMDIYTYVNVDANGCAPVSLAELKSWFAQVNEPACCVKWPWWVNVTGDEQIERDLEVYKREVVIR